MTSTWCWVISNRAVSSVEKKNEARSISRTIFFTYHDILYMSPGTGTEPVEYEDRSKSVGGPLCTSFAAHVFLQ